MEEATTKERNQKINKMVTEFVETVRNYPPIEKVQLFGKLKEEMIGMIVNDNNKITQIMTDKEREKKALQEFMEEISPVKEEISPVKESA